MEPTERWGWEWKWKRQALILILEMSLGTLGLSLVEWSVSAICAEPGPPESMVITLAQRYPTPEVLARFLKKEIKFQEDKRLFGQPDYWQDPEEFLAHRAGDCEDYALLAQAVLTLQGKEAFLFSLYGPEGYAHTICVFVEAGRYNVINEDRVIRYRANSLEELAALLNPAWRWAAVAEKTGHRGRSVREIRNPSPLPSHAVSSRSSLYSDLLS